MEKYKFNRVKWISPSSLTLLVILLNSCGRVPQNNIDAINYKIDSIAKAENEAVMTEEGNAPPVSEIKKIPEFKLPIPKFSAQTEIDKSLFSTKTYLKDIDHELKITLSICGYEKLSYFRVSNSGFAIVTEMEQIEKDGNPKPENDRWVFNPNASLPSNEFSMLDYIKCLFRAQKGYYRCIVFIITDQFLSSKSIPPTRQEINEFVEKGGNKLPKKIGDLKLTKNYTINAIIYEYVKEENSVEPQLQKRLSARTHLASINFYKNLK